MSAGAIMVDPLSRSGCGRSADSVRVLLLVLVLALLGAGCQGSSAAAGLSGRIAWPKDGDLWVLDARTKESKRLTQLPRGAAVTGATWSPDGRQIAYAQFMRRPGDNASGSDLWILGADGSNPRVLVERDQSGTVLETPTWSQSGNLYFTQRRVQGGRERMAIMRKSGAEAAEVLVEDAFGPSVAADESALVYVRTARAGQVLLKQALNGGGTCELLTDEAFLLVGLPRISPDGTRVAFPASGDLNPSARQGTCGPAAGGAIQDQAPNAVAWIGRLGDWLGLAPRVAHAHGLPWDIWVMNLDGSGLYPVADLNEDEPNVTWSPDGTRLAVFGPSALYIVDIRGGEPVKLVDQGGYGALDWAKQAPN